MSDRHYLTVDGFFHGTGIRNPFSGKYLEIETLHVSVAFRHRFAAWLERYHQANDRYDEDRFKPYLQKLDEEGLQLAKELKAVLGGEVKIIYYSDAFGKRFLT